MYRELATREMEVTEIVLLLDSADMVEYCAGQDGKMA